MTYCWGNEHDKGNYSYWSDMVQSVMPHSRAPYWWIDVLCLPQHDESAKMPTVRRSHKIYENAKEYHIIGYRTLLRGWCISEMGASPLMARQDCFYSYLALKGRTAKLEQDYYQRSS